MRFVTSFITLFIFILIIVASEYYFTREYFLYRGVENFKKTILTVQKSNTTVCSTREDLLDTLPVEGQPTVQLRFTSDTEYLVEILCPGYQFDPVLVMQGELDRYVSKVPGSSGILVGEDRTGVELAVFKNVHKQLSDWAGRDVPFIEKSKKIIIENGAFIVAQPEDELGSGPITSCEGFGYQCCQLESQIGIGNTIEGLQGCEKTCFSSCASRPFVLSFTSNPFFDVKTRIVEISDGESIDFSYVVDPGESDAIQVFVDYGDGSSDQSLEKNGMFSHIYNCPADECEYSARMTVTDSAGVESAWTPVSLITVKVLP